MTLFILWMLAGVVGSILIGWSSLLDYDMTYEEVILLAIISTAGALVLLVGIVRYIHEESSIMTINLKATAFKKREKKDDK